MVLPAVYFRDIDGVAFRIPGDIGKIAVGGLAGLQIAGRAGLCVEDADRHLMAGHACHGIFRVFERRYPCRNIYQRVVGDHAFIHAVKSQFFTVGRPKDASVDAEFVAVYRLSVDNRFVFSIGNGSMLVVLILDIQVVVNRIRQ